MSRQNISHQEDSDFIKHLKKVSKIVDTWPAWEQTILGTSNTSHHSPKNESGGGIHFEPGIENGDK